MLEDLGRAACRRVALSGSTLGVSSHSHPGGQRHRGKVDRAADYVAASPMRNLLRGDFSS